MNGAKESSQTLVPPNIYIIGAQCTGKTTLVAALQAHFESTSASPSSSPAILVEVARGVLRKHSFRASDIESSSSKALQLQCLILQAQNEAECAIEHQWFVSDRSGIDTAVYAEQFGGPGAIDVLMKESSWSPCLQRMRSALVVVCEAGVPWLTDDGVRLMPKSEREWMDTHDLFCKRLQSLDIDFVVLPRDITTLKSRVAFVIQCWEEKRTP